MKKVLVALAVCAVIAMSLIPTASADKSDSAVIDGFIMINGTFSENKDITITFYTENVNYVRVVGIDKEGHFSIEVPGNIKSDKCLISFKLNGCSVSSLPSTITEDSVKTGDEVCYRLSKDFAGGTISAGQSYTLCGKGLHSITMNSTFGTVKGIVMTNSEKPVGINDVKVTLMDGDTVKMVVTTSKGGRFSMDNCPTGTYTIKFSASGYSDVSETIIVENGVTHQMTVTMERSGVVSGLNIVQITMIVCGVIAGILILVAIVGFLLNRLSGKDFIFYKKGE